MESEKYFRRKTDINGRIALGAEFANCMVIIQNDKIIKQALTKSRGNRQKETYFITDTYTIRKI